MTIALWISLLPMNIITEVANELKISKELVAAIVSIESSGDPKVTRYENHYKWFFESKKHAFKLRITEETEIIHQKTSWGLAQIMGGTARYLGYSDHLTKLSRPKTGLYWAMMYLKSHLTKYENVMDAVAAFNAGQAIKDDKGNYTNQEYVNKVKVRFDYLNSLAQN